jgi:hypothetical protein
MITAMATPNPVVLVEAISPGHAPHGVMTKGLAAMKLCRAMGFALAWRDGLRSQVEQEEN